MYKYYSKLRPVSLGTYPKNQYNPLIDFCNYDKREEHEGVLCWGELYYRFPLEISDLKQYDLHESEENDV